MKRKELYEDALGRVRVRSAKRLNEVLDGVHRSWRGKRMSRREEDIFCLGHALGATDVIFSLPSDALKMYVKGLK